MIGTYDEVKAANKQLVNRPEVSRHHFQRATVVLGS